MKINFYDDINDKKDTKKCFQREIRYRMVR